MSERVDLVDAHGRIRERSLLRKEAEGREDLYMQIAIVVIFNRTGDILVHQRSKKKSVNPGDIDHVCGGVLAGEEPEAAAVRETKEETGVSLQGLQLVLAGTNKYDRYRWLFVATSEDKPVLTEPDAIDWVAWKSLEELVEGRDAETLTFVDDFFEETALAKEALCQGGR